MGAAARTAVAVAALQLRQRGFCPVPVPAQDQGHRERAGQGRHCLACRVRKPHNSALANTLFTRELARRLAGTEVTANCAHPGVVRTGFGREGSPLVRLAITIGRPFLLSPERGAGTIVYLATSADVADATGGYYAKAGSVSRPGRPGTMPQRSGCGSSARS